MAGYSLGDADLLRPRDGQEDPLRDGEAAGARSSLAGSVKNGVPKAQAETIFELLAKFRRLRLQQEPRRGLCAGVVSHRLYEGALYPVEFLAAVR